MKYLNWGNNMKKKYNSIEIIVRKLKQKLEINIDKKIQVIILLKK